MKALLSIDGGGMRGVIPARFLAALEERTGKLCHQLFDLIAGTSTGGILALGLAKPYRAQDLVGLYQQKGPTIFARSLEHEAVTLNGMAGPKYPADGIESVLASYFGTTLISAALTPVLVTGYDCQLPGPSEFTSWRTVAMMRDVARATSAAPTFFPPLKLGGSIFVDGGVFANNPTMRALTKMRELWGPHPDPDLSWYDDVLVVSLGTGNTEKKFDPSSWGLVDWARMLATTFMDGNADVVADEVRDSVGPYYRFQTELAGVTSDMDDASSGTVSALIGLADAMVAANAQLIDSLATRLTSPR